MTRGNNEKTKLKASMHDGITRSYGTHQQAGDSLNGGRPPKFTIQGQIAGCKEVADTIIITYMAASIINEQDYSGSIDAVNAAVKAITSKDLSWVDPDIYLGIQRDTLLSKLAVAKAVFTELITRNRLSEWDVEGLLATARAQLTEQRLPKSPDEEGSASRGTLRPRS